MANLQEYLTELARSANELKVSLIDLEGSVARVGVFDHSRHYYVKRSKWGKAFHPYYMEGTVVVFRFRNGRPRIINAYRDCLDTDFKWEYSAHTKECIENRKVRSA